MCDISSCIGKKNQKIIGMPTAECNTNATPTEIHQTYGTQHYKRYSSTISKRTKPTTAARVVNRRRVKKYCAAALVLRVSSTTITVMLLLSDMDVCLSCESMLHVLLCMLLRQRHRQRRRHVLRVRHLTSNVVEMVDDLYASSVCVCLCQYGLMGLCECCERVNVVVYDGRMEMGVAEATKEKVKMLIMVRLQTGYDYVGRLCYLLGLSIFYL